MSDDIGNKRGRSAPKITSDQEPKKYKKPQKKYPYKKKILYKPGDKVGCKEIVRYLTSRGGHHYYVVRCINCNGVDVMYQEALRVSKGCRRCFRILSGYQGTIKQRRGK